jgi:hypothetical protein
VADGIIISRGNLGLDFEPEVRAAPPPPPLRCQHRGSLDGGDLQRPLAFCLSAWGLIGGALFPFLHPTPFACKPRGPHPPRPPHPPTPTPHPTPYTQPFY